MIGTELHRTSMVPLLMFLTFCLYNIPFLYHHSCGSPSLQNVPFILEEWTGVRVRISSQDISQGLLWFFSECNTVIKPDDLGVSIALHVGLEEPTEFTGTYFQVCLHKIAALNHLWRYWLGHWSGGLGGKCSMHQAEGWYLHPRSLVRPFPLNPRPCSLQWCRCLTFCFPRH